MKGVLAFDFYRFSVAVVVIRRHKSTWRRIRRIQRKRSEEKRHMDTTSKETKGMENERRRIHWRETVPFGCGTMQIGFPSCLHSSSVGLAAHSAFPFNGLLEAETKPVVVLANGAWSRLVSKSTRQHIRLHIWYFTLSACDAALPETLSIH